jgi:hypothetical protein
MQDCIDACLRCYQTCLGMASNHCLPAGGGTSSRSISA